jgi:hypothetical protein
MVSYIMDMLKLLENNAKMLSWVHINNRHTRLQYIIALSKEEKWYCFSPSAEKGTYK